MSSASAGVSDELQRSPFWSPDALDEKKLASSSRGVAPASSASRTVTPEISVSASIPRVTPLVSIGSSNPELQRKFNTLVTPKVYSIIEKIIDKPDLFEEGPLWQHPHVTQIRDVLVQFRTSFPVEGDIIKGLLIHVSEIYVDQALPVEQLQKMNKKVKNMVSSVLFDAVAQIDVKKKKEDESCIIC